MSKILVCFAVKEEAKVFHRLADARPDVRVLVTGIGRRNAEKSFREAIARQRPELVISSGFAGGLRPELALGDMVFSADPESKLESALLSAGAKPGKLLCVDRIATTAREKLALRNQSGADAVEMESEAIRAVCREEKIPAATVRVILDTADEDLVLDFNQFLTADKQFDHTKLAWAVATSPGKVGALMRLQKQGGEAAGKLAVILMNILGSATPLQRGD
jgi:adenosylhomocysteine nucleosidase